jgi:serine/threonine protein kinase
VQTTLKKVKNSKFEFPVEVPLDARPIISGLLSNDPNMRITLDAIINSNYFEGLNESKKGVDSGFNKNGYENDN